MQVVKVLSGHTSQETAFLVEDYPYGRLRCKIRYWLERKETKGFRFVSQTENPKNGRWNAPKMGTYVDLCANMYIDEKGHCTWACVTSYSDAEKTREFLTNFPDTDVSILKHFVKAKIAYLRAGARGAVRWEINGVAKEPTKEELSDYSQDAKDWLEIARMLGMVKPA